MANHPVSSLTQANWRKPKDTLPSLEGGKPSLNRTGVLLPQIQGGGLGVGMGMKPPTYKFEAGGMPPKPKDENVQVRANTFKVKSGGGAGFSSGTNAASTDNPSTSMYEPGSAQRRTPRRTLGNILNKNAMQADMPHVP